MEQFVQGYLEILFHATKCTSRARIFISRLIDSYPDYLQDLGLSISSLECWNLLVAARLWLPALTRSTVLIFCDNWAKVAAINSGPCSTEQQIQQVCPVNGIPLTTFGGGGSFFLLSGRRSSRTHQETRHLVITHGRPLPATASGIPDTRSPGLSGRSHQPTAVIQRWQFLAR